jgi:hypothetical protein
MLFFGFGKNFRVGNVSTVFFPVTDIFSKLAFKSGHVIFFVVGKIKKQKHASSKKHSK